MILQFPAFMPVEMEQKEEIQAHFRVHQALTYELTCVNREQDLGVPGLRRAKESYQPHDLVHKYRVTLAAT